MFATDPVFGKLKLDPSLGNSIGTACFFYLRRVVELYIGLGFGGL